MKCTIQFYTIIQLTVHSAFSLVQICPLLRYTDTDDVIQWVCILQPNLFASLLLFLFFCIVHNRSEKTSLSYGLFSSYFLFSAQSSMIYYSTIHHTILFLHLYGTEMKVYIHMKFFISSIQINLHVSPGFNVADIFLQTLSQGGAGTRLI